MVGMLVTLFLGAFVTNLAVSFAPHEPLVIWFGKEVGVLSTAIVATLGTVAACWVDRRYLFPLLLRKREIPRDRGLVAKLVNGFDRAPFAIVALSGLTPLPFWPFKVLGVASDYPTSKFLAAVAVGRFPRYLLLAWLGRSLPLPPWAMPTICVALTLWAIAVHVSDGRKAVKNEKAKRKTDSLTSSWEKENLPRIAARLPAWVTPDHLTALGIGAAFVIGLGYILANRSPLWLLLSVVGLALHWFGDSLDGTLARVRKIERERYGYYVDRTADAISLVVICAAFGLSPYLRFSIAMLLAVSYLLIMVYAEICAYVSRRFPLSFARLGPTEARIALGLFTLALVFWQPPMLAIGSLQLNALELAAILVSLGIIAAFVVMSAKEARRLDRMDRSLLPSATAESGEF
jgi:archaetidylinositol phosphate synthase